MVTYMIICPSSIVLSSSTYVSCLHPVCTVSFLLSRTWTHPFQNPYLSVSVLDILVYHLPSGFLSFSKKEPLPELFPQTPDSSYSWPRRTRWWIRLSLHLVLGLPCRLVYSRGIYSVTLIVHLLSLNRAMCPLWTPLICCF